MDMNVYDSGANSSKHLSKLIIS